MKTPYSPDEPLCEVDFPESNQGPLSNRRCSYHPPKLEAFEFAEIVRGTGSMAPDQFNPGPTGPNPIRPGS